MSELRQDPMTGEWAIVAPERGRRPLALDVGRPETGDRAAFDPSCPFCPGNEAQLPSVIAEVKGSGAPGWKVRVVPNKYPAVAPETPPPAPGERMHHAAPARGYHEVVIETPRHDGDLVSLGADDVEAVVRMYRDRSIALAARPGIASVVVFRNRGAGGGASLAHPHSQIVALAEVPPRLARIAAWAQARHEADGACVVCRELAAEVADGRRVVEAHGDFIVLVPFAAAAPCEMRIVPQRHRASFADADDGEIAALAGVLRRSLARLDDALGSPPYRLAFDCWIAPPGGAPHLHWWLRIVPDLVRPGGFELGAGLPINPSAPEDDAARLRAQRSTPSSR